MDVYIVSYDICEPKRLRRVHDCLCGWGRRIQYSVFHCRLRKCDLVRLRGDLAELINFAEDQVLFFCLGPAGGRGEHCTESLGKIFDPPPATAYIV